MESSEHPHAQPEVASVTSSLSLSPQVLLITSGLAALIAVVAFYFLRGTTAKRGNTVLILGPSDAGKTAVFTTLSYATTLPSHTSLQPNKALLTLSTEGAKKAPPLQLVDVPGHPRIRAQFLDYLPDTMAIVFVVDASTIARNGPVVAEHLHTILHAVTSLPPSQKTPSIIIQAHKADLLNTRSTTNQTGTISLAVDRVRTILERELEKRRVATTTGVGVEGLGADGEEATIGGLECTGPTSSFKFENWDGGDIEFVGGWVDVKRDDGIESEKVSSGKGSVDGLALLKDWLEGIS